MTKCDGLGEGGEGVMMQPRRQRGQLGMCFCALASCVISCGTALSVGVHVWRCLALSKR